MGQYGALASWRVESLAASATSAAGVGSLRGPSLATPMLRVDAGHGEARAARVQSVDPYIALICFPVIFLGELPDKTMFASLVMATKGRPLHVWIGSAVAFLIHVVIAVTVGVALFHILPHEAVDAVVAGLFLFGAAYAWREGTKEEVELAEREASRHGVILTAFLVIFLAEWGDLTQILMANLAARYHSPVSVAVGSVLALWAVAAIAVTGGQALVRFVNVAIIRKVMAVILVVLAGVSAWSAAH